MKNLNMWEILSPVLDKIVFIDTNDKIPANDYDPNYVSDQAKLFFYLCHVSLPGNVLDELGVLLAGKSFSPNAYEASEQFRMFISELAYDMDKGKPVIK